MSKISPAQIQVLQSTTTGSHPLTNGQQPTSDSSSKNGPVHPSELRFTSQNLPPVFGNLLSNLVKPGTATMSAAGGDASYMEQQQNSSSHISAGFASGKMDQAVNIVKTMPSRMASWASFFDPKQFSMPNGGGDLMERLKANLGGFYANYLVVCCVLLTYCLLTSPLLLVVAVIYGILAYSIVSRGQDLVLLGQALSTNQQLLGLTVCSLPIFLILGLTGVFFWLIGASTCLIALHALFHNPLKVVHDNIDLETAENGGVGFTGNLPPDARGGPAFQVVNL